MKTQYLFDASLALIVGFIAFSQLRGGMAWGNALNVIVAMGGALIIRFTIRAHKASGWAYWISEYKLTGMGIAFVSVANFVYVFYAFSEGYLGIIDSVGGYLLSTIVFSAVLCLIQESLTRLLQIIRRKK